jgi:hypothetical protein
MEASLLRWFCSQSLRLKERRRLESETNGFGEFHDQGDNVKNEYY